MIGTQQKNLKEEIIEILLQKPASSKKLKTLLKEKKHDVTIQAVYKQLNTLLEAGVILKNKQIYNINNEWIKNISKVINVQDIELPQIGEKFTYKFNSLQKLDAHWKHIMTSFHKNFPDEPFFSYCPHQIWIYVLTRGTSERNMQKEHEENKYYNFYNIGGDTDLDKKFKKEFQGHYYRVETHTIKGARRNTYISIFENNIISTTIKKELSSKIDTIYSSLAGISEKEENIKDILSGNHTCTLSIEHNKNKAYRLKKQISQPFYIPEDIREGIKKQSL